MQAVMEKQKRQEDARGINFEMPKAIDCFQVKENFDALFCGDLRIEDATAAVKRVLFGHLETCRACCRTFDKLVRYRPPGRDRIF